MKSVVALLIVALLAAPPGFAQKQTQDPSTPTVSPDDPPTRVARLNWLSGDVAFQPAGLDDWTNATLNYPLSTSDHLFTGKDSRVELHVGPNVLRLDSNSNFAFLNLDDSIVQVSLTEGSLEIRLRVLDDDDSFEIATPNGAVTLLRTGDYRIDTDAERDATMLTVRAGSAELFSGASSVIIRAQETAYFRTDQNPDIRSANDMDDFDSFAAAREDSVPMSATTPVSSAGNGRPIDRFLNRVSVPDLVAEGMTGAEDLASYGNWQNSPGYGDVWVPPVDPDWAPYGDGSWAWVGAWGWTWIDAAPWGFAPFHYGRWAYVNTRWLWVPGPRNTAQVYAPALVAFVGGGAADSVSWYPLGPNAVYNPPWGNNPAIPLPGRVPIIPAAPGGLHTMSQSDFVAGGQVRPVVALTSQGQVLGPAPPVVPMRASVLVGSARMRPPVVDRPLILRTAPPPAPVSFAATLGVLAQNQGRPLAPKQVEYLRRQLPAAVMQRQAVRYSVPLVSTRRVPKVPAVQPKGRGGAPSRQGP